MKKRHFLAPLAVSFAALLTAGAASAGIAQIHPVESISVFSQGAKAAPIQDSDFVLRHGPGVTLIDAGSSNQPSTKLPQPHSSHGDVRNAIDSSHGDGGHIAIDSSRGNGRRK